MFFNAIKRWWAAYRKKNLDERIGIGVVILVVGLLVFTAVGIIFSNDYDEYREAHRTPAEQLRMAQDLCPVHEDGGVTCSDYELALGRLQKIPASAAEYPEATKLRLAIQALQNRIKDAQRKAEEARDKLVHQSEVKRGQSMKYLIFALLSAMLVLCGCTKKYQIVSSAKEGDSIAFTIAHGQQKIKAVCNSIDMPCQNLALKAGEPIDCYFNPSNPQTNDFSKHIPMRAVACLMCHLREGKGEYFVMHSRDCVDLRKVDIPDVVLHKTKDKDWEKFIGETFTTYTVKCARTSGCGSYGSYGEFVEFTGPKSTYLDLDKTIFQQPDPFFTLVWRPAKEWFLQSDSDADVVKETQDKLDSHEGSSEGVGHQFFDEDGVQLPKKYGDYYQNGDKPQFCKNSPDKFFNTRGKEVEDDTLFLDVKEIK